MADILSEGEKTLLGLAAFLAELEASDRDGPIVLDDPVSGLDSANKRIVADRMAAEAGKRQVVVLTHDNEFASMLQFAAKAAGCRHVQRAMTRNGNVVGIVA